MIRFVDLTEAYFTDPLYSNPCCAFVSTNTDHFLQTDTGEHIFFGQDEIDEHAYADRMKRLMPDGFFEETSV